MYLYLLQGTELECDIFLVLDGARGAFCDGAGVRYARLFVIFFFFCYTLQISLGWHYHESAPTPFRPPSHRGTGMKRLGLVNLNRQGAYL